VLTDHEARGLAELSRSILSIGDGSDVAPWVQSVERSFRTMLGADVVGLAVPVPGPPVMFISSEAKQGAIDNYMAAGLPEQEREWGTKSRLIELGVSSRRMLHGGHLREYYRSELWNELIVPNRLFDTVAVACRVAPGREAFAFMIHGQSTGRKFGETGLNRLRAIFPVFRSAVRAAQHASPVSNDVARIVDALPTALALGDELGRVVHQNAALTNLLSREPQRALLVHAISRLLFRIAAVGRDRAGVAALALWHESPFDSLQLGVARYRLSGSVLAADGLAPGPRAMIVVERFGPHAFPDRALRLRSLTAREIDVARLVADGTSSDRIASALGISCFTARHHVENIMRKLDVHSRAAIVAAVARLAAESP
jgi:DNA-binding CsgD family transcriptional regulator